MAELGYYSFWPLVHQARLEFLDALQPAQQASGGAPPPRVLFAIAE